MRTAKAIPMPIPALAPVPRPSLLVEETPEFVFVIPPLLLLFPVALTLADAGIVGVLVIVFAPAVPACLSIIAQSIAGEAIGLCVTPPILVHTAASLFWER